MLEVLEVIAQHQPIGVSELSRVMDADKSAVQRAIMTLADGGWIHPAPGSSRQWQLTGHIQLVAHMARGSSSLRQRALPALTALRDATGESIFLTVPDIGRFVVVEVVESRHLLRTAPHIGMVVEPDDSATGRAVLPFLSPERQAEFLGGPPDAALSAGFAATLATGYAISEDHIAGGSINIAAPIFEVDGRPSAAIVLSAPRERLTRADYDRMGAAVLAAGRGLSLAPPESIPTKAERERHGADRDQRDWHRI